MREGSYLVAGLGKTGLSIARWLTRKGHSFVLYDTRSSLPNITEIEQNFQNTACFLAAFPKSRWEGIHTLICSPGIPDDAAILQEARARAIPIIGDIECLAREVNAPLLAITGTNGKSTVTMLLGEMAKTAGMRVAVAGNIGTPVLDLLQDQSDYDLWVLELSSFQLQQTQSLRPKVACILNISPDHLDRHHAMDAYIAAKQRIYDQADICVFNAEDPATRPQAAPKHAKRCAFTLNPPSAQAQWGIITHNGKTSLAYADTPWLEVDALRCIGQHYWRNALAAAAMARQAGIPDAAVKQVLRTFKGLPHRTEWLRKHHGVDWVNDSKGTNVGATLSAIEGIGAAITGKIVLLAGGIGKDADFSALAPVVKKYVKTLIVFGTDGPRIAEALSEASPVFKAATLEEATQMADTHAQKGDTVLLSPACASFDMFEDFNARGERFRALVMAL